MPKINMLDVLRRQSAVPTQIPAPEPSAQKLPWDHPDAAWRQLPMKGTQYKPLALLLRSKDLLAATENLDLLQQVAEFDEETRRWNFEGLTRGQAATLIDMLGKLPNIGTSKIATATAQPLPKQAEQVPAEPEAPKMAQPIPVELATGQHVKVGEHFYEVFRTPKTGRITLRKLS